MIILNNPTIILKVLYEGFSCRNSIGDLEDYPGFSVQELARAWGVKQSVMRNWLAGSDCIRRSPQTERPSTNLQTVDLDTAHLAELKTFHHTVGMRCHDVKPLKGRKKTLTSYQIESAREELVNSSLINVAPKYGMSVPTLIRILKDDEKASQVVDTPTERKAYWQASDNLNQILFGGKSVSAHQYWKPKCRIFTP